MVTVTDKVCIACGKELKNVPVATVFCPECRKSAEESFWMRKSRMNGPSVLLKKQRWMRSSRKQKRSMKGLVFRKIMHEATKEGLQYSCVLQKATDSTKKKELWKDFP